MTRRIHGRRRGLVIAAVGTATVALITTNADLAGAQLMGHQNRPVGPSAFRARLDRIYDTTAAMTSRGPAKPVTPPLSPAEFHDRVAALSDDQVTSVYHTAPGIWNSIERTLDRVPPMRVRNRPHPAASAPTAPGGVAPHGRAASRATLPGTHPAAATEEPPTALTGEPEEPDCPAFLLSEATGTGLVKSSFSLKVAARALEVASAVLPDLQSSPVSVGGVLDAIAAGLDGLAEEFDATLETGDSCYGQERENYEDFAVEAYKEIREFDEPLLGGQEEIKEAIADLLAGTAGGFDNLDKEIADLTTAHEQVADSTDHQLHIRLESELLSDYPSVSAELPASAGGFLNSSPTGVQKIVTEALATARANAEPIASSAPRNLALADAALTARQYKKAFHYYQLVYRAVVS